MSSLTIQEIENIALLARLALTAAEKEQYRTQLSAVLDYVEIINELTLDELPPTTHAVAQHNIWRDDGITTSLSPPEALANAAAQADDQFAIQAVFD